MKKIYRVHTKYLTNLDFNSFDNAYQKMQNYYITEFDYSIDEFENLYPKEEIKEMLEVEMFYEFCDTEYIELIWKREEWITEDSEPKYSVSNNKMITKDLYEAYTYALGECHPWHEVLEAVQQTGQYRFNKDIIIKQIEG